MTPTVEPVISRKRVKAPPEFAFRCWTEPNRLASWLRGPHDVAQIHVFEAREGGRYRLGFSGPEGTYELAGTFREIVPSERLVMTWKKTGANPDPAETLLTVRFFAIDGGTEVEVRHELLPNEDSAEQAFRDWTEILSRFGYWASMQYMMEEYTMSTTMETPTGWAGRITNERAAVLRAQNRLKDTFSHVTDDRLDYRPSATSKSPLRIVAHVGASNLHFASVLRGEKQEGEDLGAIFARIEAEEQRYKTRAEVEALIEDSVGQILAAYDQLDPVAVEANPQLQFYVTLPAYHMVNHAAQIDYIQTTWGDLQNHFGM